MRKIFQRLFRPKKQEAPRWRYRSEAFKDIPYEIEKKAQELYIKQNFPHGDSGYPDGFPLEMWWTCSYEVAKSWVEAAKKQTLKCRLNKEI